MQRKAKKVIIGSLIVTILSIPTIINGQQVIPENPRPVIMIDAGHSGSTDPGAIAIDGSRESDYNYDTAVSLNKILNDRGYETIMTRTGRDQSYSNNTRIDVANKSNADLYISIHCNSDEGSEANGFETWVTPSGIDENDTMAKCVAESINKEFVRHTGQKNRGLKIGGGFYIRHINIPSLIIEMGFLSNKSDLEVIKGNHHTLAEQIADAIENTYNNQ